MKYTDNYKIDYSRRKDGGKEDSLFLKRWSPRSYRYEEIPEDVQEALFGAARWTQSCFNEQPWLFVTESGPADREIFQSLLLPKNREWAADASLTGYIFAQRNFTRNGKPNRWASFDAGAAWMALTLQARMYGLYTHGMAGIDRSEVYKALKVPEDEYEVMCGFVIGIIDNPDNLTDQTRSREVPSARKKLGETWIRGIWSP